MRNRLRIWSGITALGLLDLLVPVARADLPDLAQLKLAAESGDAQAEFAYSREIQGPNRPDSDLWLKKSAEQGYVPAEKAWADRCEQLQGFEPKHRAIQLREAVRWTSRAAFQGLASAQGHLGVFYAEGVVLPKDPVTGYMWLQIALDNPAVDGGTKGFATSYLNHLIANMSSLDIAEGQRRAAGFLGPTGNGMNPVEADLAFSQLRLSAIVSSQGHPTAFVNNTALAAGQSKEVSLEGMRVVLDCISVDPKSTRVKIAGSDYATDLVLK